MPQLMTMDQRMKDVEAEATRRLAEQRLPASQLPAMMQRVTQEFAQQDNRRNSSKNVPNQDYFEMPNNMNSYIDAVLQKSGMTNAPTPQPRPADIESEQSSGGIGSDYAASGGDTTEQEPDASDTNEVAEGEGEAGDSDTAYYMSLLAGAGITGGAAAYIVNQLMGKSGGVGPNASAATPNARVEPTFTEGAPRGAQVEDADFTDISSLRGPEKQRALASPDMSKFSDLDKQIAETTGEMNIDTPSLQNIADQLRALRDSGRFDEGAVQNIINRALRGAVR